MDTNRRIEYIQGLRDVADFLESHPTLPLPGAQLSACVFDGDLTLPHVREIAKEFGSFKKEAMGSYITISKTFGPISLLFMFLRENVCQRIVVGTRSVEKTVYPLDVKTETEIVEEEIVEWKCPSLLSANEA